MEVDGHLHPQGKSPWYPWIGGWEGPRAVQDAVVKRDSVRKSINSKWPKWDVDTETQCCTYVIPGLFEKFVDSPYYSESELCGGVVTVSFSKYNPLASDALLATLHPLLENVLQTVDHFEISSLGAPFTRLEKPRDRKGRDLNWILCSA
jgi:hypothetical protein